MNHLRNSLRTYFSRAICLSMATLLLVFAPAPVYVAAEGDGSAPSVETCNPVVAAPTGVIKPTGSDASTYTYNECTGLWENPHYTWSPSTKVKTPKDEVVYTYNDSTGKWDAKVWDYSPSAAAWEQEAVSVDEPPAGASKVGGPKPIVATATPSTTLSGGGVTAGSDNTVTSNTTSNATLNNAIVSNAASGSVIAGQNTTVGNIQSGDANALANVINAINSSSLGSNVATFTTTIDGDVQGDLIVNPNMLQPAANTTVNTNNNITINEQNDGTITNTIALNAASGDVSADANTTAGNVTSGNATAMANIVNLMNAYVSSSQSFLGVININGNLNGNILMPENFLDTLLASNAPRDTVSISQEALNNINTTVANNSTIHNTVTSSATSGDVSASANTTVGNTTSGSATTKVTVFNLTGNTVIARNTLLVFVNVKGQWVGVLMNAPAGSTSAAYGGGVTSNTVKTGDTNVANNMAINNNVSVAAASGDASATRNTTVGNVTSGNATTNVNIANMTNTYLANTGWFGLLFINIMGNWTGSFGVVPATPATPAAGQPAAPPQVFDFVPGGFNAGVRTFKTSSFVTPSSHDDSSIAAVVNDVLGSTTQPVKKVVSPAVVHPDQGLNVALLLGSGLFAAGTLYFIVEYIRNRRAATRG